MKNFNMFQQNNFYSILTILFICLFMQGCFSPKEKKSEINPTSDHMDNYYDSINTLIPSELIDSKWEYQVVENCISYILFNEESKYDEYNCERDYNRNGIYNISNDTISLIELDLVSNLPDETRVAPIARNNYLFMGDSLKYISREVLKNGECVHIYTPSQKIVYFKHNHR